MTAITNRPNEVLIDRLPSKVVLDAQIRDVVAIVSFALLTAALAQLEFILPFTPIPITGQTFAVLLTGAVLGPWRGVLSQGLYVALGAVGLPFYSGGESGLLADSAESSGLELIPTFGYLVGFVVAAYVVGLMATRRQDRTVLSSIPAFLAGSVIIYVFGATYLAYSFDIPFVAELDQPSALAWGIAPFIVGDVVKATAAGLLLPAAWKTLDRFKS